MEEAKKCAVCGAPATCFGAYEGHETSDYGCDDCCGHGNEDGRCEPVPRRYTLRVSCGEDGWTGQLEELPECITQGDTLAQVQERIREALALVLDDDAAAIDAVITTKSVIVCPDVEVERPTFEEQLEKLINSYSVENASDTPDFILARHASMCLSAFAETTRRRDKWYGHRTMSTPREEIPGLANLPEIPPDVPRDGQLFTLLSEERARAELLAEDMAIVAIVREWMKLDRDGDFAAGVPVLGALASKLGIGGVR